MSAENATPNTSAHPSTDRPTCSGRAGRKPDHYDSTKTSTKNGATTYRFENSRVRLELGPAGVIARIERFDGSGPEYAGPLPRGTIDALVEVAYGV